VSTDQHTSASATGSTNGVGVAGFVTGLLGALLFWFPLAGIILGLLGVVLGGVGTAQGRRNGQKTGLAVAGIVLGALALIVSIVFVTVVVANA
jgi:hypothetical protein